MKDPLFLLVDEVLELQARLLAEHGGQQGVRDRGLLESAVATPQASFGGDFLHEDIFAMAAAYAFHLASNHPFIDGNKRIALAAAATFLAVNGYEITADDEALYQSMIAVASGNLDKDALTDFFRANTAKATAP